MYRRPPRLFILVARTNAVLLDRFRETHRQTRDATTLLCSLATTLHAARAYYYYYFIFASQHDPLPSLSLA
jgi:hypothetical protein